MELTWDDGKKAFTGTADKAMTVTHVQLWSAKDPGPKSLDPEDVEAWLADDEQVPAVRVLELTMPHSLGPGDTLALDPSSIGLGRA